MLKSLFRKKDPLDDDAKKIELARLVAGSLQPQISVGKELVGKEAIEDENGGPKRKAIGYVCGSIDAALRVRNFEFADMSVGVPVTFHVLRILWADRANEYLEFLVKNIKDPLVTVGMLRGGQEYLDHINSGGKKLPIGLADYLTEGDALRENFIKFQKLVRQEGAYTPQSDASSRLEVSDLKPNGSALNYFEFGKFKLDEKLDDLTGLVEFSAEKYRLMIRRFKGEKNYDAPPINFLGRQWQLMISTVHGQICKVAVNVSLSNEREATPVAMEALQYCKERLGSPSEQKTGPSTPGTVFFWDTKDGNVVLHTVECVEGFLIAISLTSHAMRKFDLL